jgi:hypothetical protein
MLIFNFQFSIFSEITNFKFLNLGFISNYKFQIINLSRAKRGACVL